LLQSVVDEIISWRMAKAQQMRRNQATVQPFPDLRMAVPNETLEDAFRRRHHGFWPANDDHHPTAMAA
jgi:hypothetical protein